MSRFDPANRGERHQADLFLADLLRTAPTRARRRPSMAAAPPPSPSAPAALPPDTAGRLFDRVVHGAGAVFAGEALDAAFEPVALPGSSTPSHALLPGDLVVLRALGEGWLGDLRVLDEDIAVSELYDPEGRIRRDTLVLRVPHVEGRPPAESEPTARTGDLFDEPGTPGMPGDKLYRVSAGGGVTTAVYVPDAARATDPVTMLVWIHGDLTCGDEGDDPVALVQSKRFALVQQLSDSRRPWVLVAPSMQGHRRRSHALGQPQAMNSFLEDVRSGLTHAGWTSAPAVGPVILAGHAQGAAVLGALAAGVRDPEWSRGALATVGDVWLLDPTCSTADTQRHGKRWTAFAQARSGVQLRIFYRRDSATAPMVECIRAAAAGLRNVHLVDSDPAVSHCEMPRAHLPELLSATGELPVAASGAPAPPAPASAFRRWYITPYHLAAEPEASRGPRVPVLTSGGDVIARVPASFFAEMAPRGWGRLHDGRLLTGDGWRSPTGHDYAPVLAVHRRRYPGSNREARLSGITVVGDDVKTVRAYAVVPAPKAGVGYGVLHGIPLQPFRTVAADLGGFESSDRRYRGAWSDRKERYVVVPGKTGLVPTGTRVYVRQLDGAVLPDGTRHDGWLVVNDTGPSIHGARFGVFVGDKRHREPLLALTGGPFVDVWFDGIEARVPVGYDDGLPEP